MNKHCVSLWFHFIRNSLLQLRGAQILDAVRLHKNGFPECLTYGEFWRRYRILSDDLHPHKKEPGHQEMKSAVEELLTEMDLDKSAFRMGNTQVGNDFKVKIFWECHKIWKKSPRLFWLCNMKISGRFLIKIVWPFKKPELY